MTLRRSAAVAIAVTLHQLREGKTSGWTPDQELVLDALRRSASRLTEATEAQLSAYLRALEPEQLAGVASNVKGIFHEMLIVRAENVDGDAMTAQLFEQTNEPGADIEFIVDGDVVNTVQIKAIQDPAAIVEHFSRYPDIDVMSTAEAFAATSGAFGDRLTSSGIANDEITEVTRETLDDLADQDLGEFVQDGVLTSVLVGGALQARAVLQGQAIDMQQVRSTLEVMGIATGTAMTMDVLLNLA